jgi:hypothetical protein
MVMTEESFSDGVDTAHGGTGANPLVDNTGVSFTNFYVGETDPLPEPASWILTAGAGVLGSLVLWKTRRRKQSGAVSLAGAVCFTDEGTLLKS